MRVIFILAVVCAGCASDPSSGGKGGWRMPDEYTGRAPAAAYTADGMMFRKDMPHQASPPNFEFYYKHCSVNGDESYYSKTSYDCSGPY